MIVFLRKLWVFVRPYRARLFLGLLCGMFYGLTNGALIGGSKLVTDLIFDGSTNFHEKLVKAAAYGPSLFRPAAQWLADALPEIHAPAPDDRLGWLLIIGVIPAVMLVRVSLAYLNIYLMNWSAMRAIADIRTHLFDHLQNLPLSFFSRASTGDLIARITSDTQILHGIIGNSFASAVKDPVTIVVLAGAQLLLQPQLTLISLLIMPVCLVPITIYARKVRKSARAMQTHNSALTTLMHEAFTANRIVKAYNLEPTVVRQFRETTKKYISHMMRVLRSNEIPGQLMEFLGASGIALVFFYILQLPKEQQPTPGDLFTFILTIVMLYPPIKAMARLHNQLHQAQAASARVFELLDTQSDVVDPARPVPLNARGADIHFEHVDFNYSEKPVLRGINLDVKAGQFVALVGQTGSGKTTITNLLLRFYDPQHGSVKIAGTDIRHVSIKDLRRQIALVTQETILFHDTIRANIAVGRPGATDAEIEAAARAANAHEFILQRAEGYNTAAGEKGVNVSGGQRQRIAIARAILKDAPILILDEATSALDSEVERAVQAELEKLMKGRTTFCIAHRLSTVQKADLIVVLQEGRIVETGTHPELLARGGVYQRLYELQFNA